jgi:molecular chaperone DnaK
VRTALEGTDASAVKTATDELQASMLKIGEAVYSAQAAGDGASAAGDGDAEAAPEGTVEGEFREV